MTTNQQDTSQEGTVSKLYYGLTGKSIPYPEGGGDSRYCVFPIGNRQHFHELCKHEYVKEKLAQNQVKLEYLTGSVSTRDGEIAAHVASLLPTAGVVVDVMQYFHHRLGNVARRYIGHLLKNIDTVFPDDGTKLYYINYMDAVGGSLIIPDVVPLGLSVIGGIELRKHEVSSGFFKLDDEQATIVAMNLKSPQQLSVLPKIERDVEFEKLLKLKRPDLVIS